jgi:hypothetical protein
VSAEPELPPEEYVITVRDQSRQVVLFRRVHAHTAEDALLELVRGLSYDANYGTGDPLEREVDWPILGLEIIQRNGDVVIAPSEED